LNIVTAADSVMRGVCLEQKDGEEGLWSMQG